MLQIDSKEKDFTEGAGIQQEAGAEPLGLSVDRLDKKEEPKDSVDEKDVVRPQPSPFVLKHPLQNVWTLWYLETDRSKSWEDMQNEITSFCTVEDFWLLYNNIKQPSELKAGCDFSLFKYGIRPMWEDSANKEGGRWVMNVPKNPKADLDDLWVDVLLCLIGEAFDNSEHICGAVINVRGKYNKISVWTSDGKNKAAVMEIGMKLQEVLHLTPNVLQYQLHMDTIIKHGSNKVVKPLYNL